MCKINTLASTRHFTFFLLCALAQSVTAQNPDDAFSAKPDDDKPLKKAEEAAQVLRQAKEHPIITSLKQKPPKTLFEVTRALQLTLGINDFEAFKKYAQQWLDLKPAHGDLVRLANHFGTQFFWEIRQRPEVAPIGRNIGDLILNASAQQDRDLNELRAAVQDLNNESKQRGATQRLFRGGPDGVVILIEGLAKSKSKAEQEIIRNTLIALKSEAIEPLQAALMSSVEHVRVEAATALGALQNVSSVVYLLGPAYGADTTGMQIASQNALESLGFRLPQLPEVNGFLEKQIRNNYAGAIPGALDENNHIEHWQWNDTLKTVELKKFHRDVVIQKINARLAEHLWKLSLNPDTQRYALLTLLDTQRTLNGLENLLTPPELPAWKNAEKLGIPQVEEILLYALQQRRDAAAIAAVEFLGASGRPEILASRNGQEAPLLQALRSADMRTRFAALQSVLRLESEHPHAGSQFVMETIRYFLQGHGERKVLIGHPRIAEAERLAALVSNFGYSGDTASKGSELLRKAQQHGDYEIILLSDTLDTPSVFETMQMIRQDFRTVRTPIGVMVTDNDYERGAQLTTRTDPLSIKIATPQSLELATWQLQLVTQPAATTLVSAEQRADFTAAVLNAVIKQLESGKTAEYMDYREIEGAVSALISRQPFNHAAMRILGLLGTPKSQLALVEYASLMETTNTDRKAAVEQFAVAVKKRGLFLTKTRIQQQFDLYNGSEQASPETIEILGNLLDTIEAPSQQRRE